MSGKVEIAWETPPSHGAVAIARIHAGGPAALDALIARLTGTAIDPGSIKRCDLAGIDSGLVVRLSGSGALVMPHGGPRIVAQLDGWFSGAGCSPPESPSAQLTYPEASTRVEALALGAIARGASPRAIPLLLAQAKRCASPTAGHAMTQCEQERHARLAHLLTPPIIVAVGSANVGKSSLLNAIAGRTVALAMDFAGTTRDAVAARVDLDGLVVDWFDTPGMRQSSDPVEVAAQAIAQELVDSADLVVEVSAPGIPCPRRSGPALRATVCTRVDLDPLRESAEAQAASACVSATQRTGLSQMARHLRSLLVTDADLESDSPWQFDPGL